ncbi:MAG TPA: hypothetical protein VMX94_03740 [Armatimonadota bacterium]|nr:hypothetical protein [Armatimonadota bacterium]
MDTYGLRYIGVENGAFTATSGTIACGNARKVNLQIFLDGHSSYEVAALPVVSASGTASKNNCAAVLADKGDKNFIRPAGVGANSWHVAYRVYNGATGAIGAATDKYTLEKWG